MTVKELVLESMKVKDRKKENMMEIQKTLVLVCCLALVLVLVCNVVFVSIWVLAYMMALGPACILV